MAKLKNKLQIQQMDARLQRLGILQTATVPPSGWINAVRTAMNMSLRQLGNKLHISPQSAKEIEQREVDGSITLKGLQEAGRALNLNLVYGFIPQDGSLEAMIEKRATELAREIVMRTSASMALEDQQNSDQRLQKAIADRADEFKRELPKILWD